jgi:hypothetical protein
MFYSGHLYLEHTLRLRKHLQGLTLHSATSTKTHF